MLKVYGRPNSSNSAKVFWLLDQIGQDYDLVPAGRGFGPTDTPEFLALNPFGKVPVVQDGDLAVWNPTRCCAIWPGGSTPPRFGLRMPPVRAASTAGWTGPRSR